MTIRNATPYFFFNGNTADALALYERALGASVVTRQTFGEANSDCAIADQNRIIHAQVRIDDVEIMMSDGPSSHGSSSHGPVPESGGGQVQVALDFDDIDDMRKRFTALAEGGKVTMDLQDTFWGATFGTLVDAMGIHWMFNCTKEKVEA